MWRESFRGNRSSAILQVVQKVAAKTRGRVVISTIPYASCTPTTISTEPTRTPVASRLIVLMFATEEEAVKAAIEARDSNGYLKDGTRLKDRTSLPFAAGRLNFLVTTKDFVLKLKI